MISAQRFTEWLNTASRGSRIEYHRGYLIRDRADNWPLKKLAEAAMDAAHLGLVVLYQERHGMFDYQYMAVKG